MARCESALSGMPMTYPMIAVVTRALAIGCQVGGLPTLHDVDEIGEAATRYLSLESGQR